MKEIREIVAAYDRCRSEGKRSVLATVVHVEGSSYRRPGARMLVSEDGQLTGAISGGCLEGDALRKAMLALHQQKNKLVTYDTTDDDATFGVQLGCNGIVHILFEPLDGGSPTVIDLLRMTVSSRQNTVLVTVFSLDAHHDQIGTTAVFDGANSLLDTSKFERAEYEHTLLDDASRALVRLESSLKVLSVGSGEKRVFYQVVRPAISLLIFGAGNDAMPLVKIAAIAGWQTTVIDGRHTHALKTRFPDAHHVAVAKAAEVLPIIEPDELTAAVLMSHNYNYDLKVLEHLISSSCPYIGVLGPSKKLQNMLEDLEGAGMQISERERERIYGPVGIDIGAETAEEIALSIAAEIMAVFSNAEPASLKSKPGPIHARNAHTSEIIE